MRAFVVGKKIGSGEIQYKNITNSPYPSFFVENAIRNVVNDYASDIESLLESSNNPISTIYLTEDHGLVLQIFQCHQNKCFIITDEVLNQYQLRWLAYRLLLTNESLESINNNNIADFIKDKKVETLKYQMEHTKNQLLDNVDKLAIRDEQLRKVLEQTNDLKSETLEFGAQARKINKRSCWPMNYCNIL